MPALYPRIQQALQVLTQSPTQCRAQRESSTSGPVLSAAEEKLTCDSHALGEVPALEGEHSALGKQGRLHGEAVFKLGLGMAGIWPGRGGREWKGTVVTGTA